MLFLVCQYFCFLPPSARYVCISCRHFAPLQKLHIPHQVVFVTASLAVSCYMPPLPFLPVIVCPLCVQVPEHSFFSFRYISKCRWKCKRHTSSLTDISHSQSSLYELRIHPCVVELTIRERAAYWTHTRTHTYIYAQPQYIIKVHFVFIMYHVPTI